MHRMAVVATITWGLSLAIVFAADQPLPGRTLLIRDPTGNVLQRKLIVTGRAGKPGDDRR